MREGDAQEEEEARHERELDTRLERDALEAREHYVKSVSIPKLRGSRSLTSENDGQEDEEDSESDGGENSLDDTVESCGRRV